MFLQIFAIKSLKIDCECFRNVLLKNPWGKILATSVVCLVIRVHNIYSAIYYQKVIFFIWSWQFITILCLWKICLKYWFDSCLLSVHDEPAGFYPSSQDVALLSDAFSRWVYKRSFSLRTFSMFWAVLVITPVGSSHGCSKGLDSIGPKNVRPLTQLITFQ